MLMGDQVEPRRNYLLWQTHSLLRIWILHKGEIVEKEKESVIENDENKTYDNIEYINISSEVKSSFLDYAMSVIVARALPDARDGMKPVQRRILYGMHGLGNYAILHIKRVSYVGELWVNTILMVIVQYMKQWSEWLSHFRIVIL